MKNLLFGEPDLETSSLGLIPPRHYWRFVSDFGEWWWWRERGRWLEFDENFVESALAALPDGIDDLSLYGMQLTSQLLDGLRERYHGLKRLSLYRCHGGGELAGTVASCFPELEHVAFRQSSLDDDGLRTVVASCPRLRSLDVSHSAVTDVGVSTVVESLPRLEHLWIGHTEISDAGGLEIAAKLTGLRSLEFRNAGVDELATYQAIVTQLECLEELDLWRHECGVGHLGLVLSQRTSLRSLNLGAIQLDDREVSAIIEKLPGLERLWVGPCVLSPAVIASFDRLGQLELLDVGYSRLTSVEAVALCSNLPSSLRFLKMNNNRGLGDQVAEQIAASFSDLVYLDLRGCGVGSRGASALAGSLSGLRSLDLAGDGCLVDDSAAMNIGANLGELVELNLSGCKVTDEGAVALAQGLRQLRSLKLGNSGVTDGGVRAIAEHLPNLRELHLQGAQINDSAAFAIAESLALLEHLNLSSERLSDSAIGALNSELTRLDTVIS